MRFSKPTAGLIALLFAPMPMLAQDAVSTLLSASPFQSKPLYNGDYFTITLAVDACVLLKQTTTFDKADTAFKQVEITIDLAQMDAARTEASGSDVNIWAEAGADVTCADIVGESCVVASRPGASIPMPAGADLMAGRAHVKVVQRLIEDCH